MNDILSQSIVGIVCLCKKVMNIVVIDLSIDVECIVIPQEVYQRSAAKAEKQP